jgi:pimeloyl-ACP methyl ester carboxylesterase
MIVQTIAIEHPTRVRSLISVMSTTGEPEFGQAAPEAMGVLLSPPPVARDAYIARSLETQIWHSKKHRDAERTQADAARNYDRSFYPEGAQRQMGAIIASGSRADRLRELNVPTLVIHGRDDTLILPSGGERTAELIDGAHLLLVGDMGHDLPEPLWPLLVGSVTNHTTIADGLAVAGR